MEATTTEDSFDQCVAALVAATERQYLTEVTQVTAVDNGQMQRSLEAHREEWEARGVDYDRAVEEVLSRFELHPIA